MPESSNKANYLRAVGLSRAFNNDEQNAPFYLDYFNLIPNDFDYNKITDAYLTGSARMDNLYRRAEDMLGTVPPKDNIAHWSYGFKNLWNNYKYQFDINGSSSPYADKSSHYYKGALAAANLLGDDASDPKSRKLGGATFWQRVSAPFRLLYHSAGATRDFLKEPNYLMPSLPANYDFTAQGTSKPPLFSTFSRPEGTLSQLGSLISDPSTLGGLRTNYGALADASVTALGDWTRRGFADLRTLGRDALRKVGLEKFADHHVPPVSKPAGMTPEELFGYVYNPPTDMARWQEFNRKLYYGKNAFGGANTTFPRESVLGYSQTPAPMRLGLDLLTFPYDPAAYLDALPFIAATSGAKKAADLGLYRLYGDKLASASSAAFSDLSSIPANHGALYNFFDAAGRASDKYPYAKYWVDTFLHNSQKPALLHSVHPALVYSPFAAAAGFNSAYRWLNSDDPVEYIRENNSISQMFPGLARVPKSYTRNVGAESEPMTWSEVSNEPFNPIGMHDLLDARNAFALYPKKETK